MDEKQREDRKAALNEACRHRLASEHADDIVANAKKYYEFLQSDEAEDATRQFRCPRRSSARNVLGSSNGGTPLVEYVDDNYVNLKDVTGKWTGGWWVPVPEDAKQYVLQAIRGAYIQGQWDRYVQIKKLLSYECGTK